jgi:cytochrome c oxidase cbb3-type subunit 3
MRNQFQVFAIIPAIVTAVVVVLCWCGSVAPVAAAGQAAGRAPSSFNSGQARAPEDPAAVARGQTLYGTSCQACHGSDLRGGDMGGPNLLRSQVALTDQQGELIIPIIQGARQAQGMPNTGLNNQDAGTVAAYLRSVIATIGGQGKPPGEEKPLNIVVGDPTRGSRYFAAHCSMCHSAEGDLKDFATRYPEPKTVQARWLTGGVLSAQAGPTGKVTAEVTTTPGNTVSGSLVHIDEFLITLRTSDGTERSYRRNGALPRVVVHDPLKQHKEMLPTYTDQDIHDVTAYLVTLK